MPHMVDKKRGAPPGEGHPLHKLTDETVRIARKMHNSGVSYDKIAAELGVNQATVRYACLGQTWKHVDGAPLKHKPRPGYKPKVPHRGENHYNAKLTTAQVIEIRRRYDAHEYKSMNALAKEFGVNRMTCKFVCTRQMWKHVPEQSTPITAVTRTMIEA